MAVAGASRFLGAATLANVRGLPAQQSTLLGQGGIGAVSLLDVGRTSLTTNGIGLSASARALNNQQLNASVSTINTLFSLTGGADGNVDGNQTIIQGLRASLPASAIREDLREVVQNADGEVLNSSELDDGGVAASENGQTVDTQA